MSETEGNIGAVSFKQITVGKVNAGTVGVINESVVCPVAIHPDWFTVTVYVPAWLTLIWFVVPGKDCYCKSRNK